MSTFLSSSFTGADNTTLETLDASFAKVSGQTPGLTVAANRIKTAVNGSTPAYYVNSAVPPSADYSVEVDVYVVVNGGSAVAQAGVLGRYSAFAVTGYRAMLKTTENRVILYRQNAGTATTLGQSSVLSIPAGTTVKVRMEMVGDVISVYVNNSPTPEISVTDASPILSANLAGVTNYAATVGTTVFHLDNLSAFTYEADTTAPALTGPTAIAAGQTTATGTVSSNEATGTLYWLASANATETAATVKAASSQAVTATGTQSVGVTGLTAATAYYLHYVHRDAAGNDSTVSTSAQFTTAATAVRGIEITLYNVSAAQASLSGLRALWWDSTAPSGAPSYESTTETTDAAGLVSIDLEAVTSLSVGQNGFLLLYKLDGADHRNSLAFAGQVTLSDIG